MSLRHQTTAWCCAAVAAALLSLAMGLNQHLRRLDAGLPSPGLRHLTANELPVWFGYLLVAPLVYAVLRRLPLRAPFRRRHALLQVLFAAPAVALSIVVVTLGRVPINPQDEDPIWVTMVQYVRGYSGFFLVNYLLIAAITHALESTRREGQLAVTLERTKLAQLASQLQPHFLFNALHGVSALMERDVRRARAMLAQLAALLRSSLELPEAQLVPLRVELAWIEAYARTQELRFAGRLRVSLPAPGLLAGALCPRFLLQPLVENAIKHGARPGMQPLHIAVNMREEEGRLSIRVADDGTGFEAIPPAPGIGLSNIVHRLEMLYSGGASIRFANTSAGGAVVEIRLPLLLDSDALREPAA